VASPGLSRLRVAAAEAGISVDTPRKIEHGRVPTPAFFTVIAIARVVGLPIEARCEPLTA